MNEEQNLNNSTQDDPAAGLESESEQNPDKARRNEIKHILLGSFSIDPQGRLCAGKGGWVTPFGMGDTAEQAIVFGVKRKRYFYKSTFNNSRQAIWNVSKSMENIGRKLYLETASDAAVCYIKSILFRPVVLVFEERSSEEGGGLMLTAYCARSPIAFLAVMRAVSHFNKVLPKQITRLDAEKKKE